MHANKKDLESKIEILEEQKNLVEKDLVSLNPEEKKEIIKYIKNSLFVLRQSLRA